MLELDRIAKRYDGQTAVHEFTLSVRKGEFIVLVGPSGCGKSTTLRMVAGLEEISSGELRINGRLANSLEPKDRDLAMVFQNYALYPHLSVFENMAFSLRLRGVPKEETRAQVEAAARSMGIEALLERKPGQLSGGQRQRVAMGRAIVRNPSVFLFDEPLSNLDANLRTQMRAEIKKLHRRLGATILYVTHDQVEAMTLADRIVVMNQGRIEQVGTPREIYHRPENTFVASFMGSPPMNLIEQGDRIVGVRPEDLKLDRSAPASLKLGPVRLELPFEIELVETLGARSLVHGRASFGPIVVSAPEAEGFELGQTVGASAPVSALTFFDRVTSKVSARTHA
jgi:ABC-type sugar transport system ATPase subunit